MGGSDSQPGFDLLVDTSLDSLLDNIDPLLAQSFPFATQAVQLRQQVISRAHPRQNRRTTCRPLLASVNERCGIEFAQSPFDFGDFLQDVVQLTTHQSSANIDSTLRKQRLDPADSGLDARSARLFPGGTRATHGTHRGSSRGHGALPLHRTQLPAQVGQSGQ
jgi:hypothetical protein